MQPFTVHTGRAAPLRRSDVDTDQIIPSEWLKRVERTGFGAGLFSAWRGTPGFVLDKPEYAGVSILLAEENFGTGSSREHAVWALQDFGFRAVICPRFADIFRGNSLKSGLLPVLLDAAVVEKLMDTVEADPSCEITVDLQNRVVRWAGSDPGKAEFELDDYSRWRLLEGLDDIALTLRHSAVIDSFEAARPSFKPRLSVPVGH